MTPRFLCAVLVAIFLAGCNQDTAVSVAPPPVALNSDASVKQLKGPLRPVQAEGERAYALAALTCVDAIVIFHEPRLTAEIRALRPDVYVKAGDYTLATLDPGERAALEETGARIEFMPFLPGFSTTQLIAKIKAAGGV